MFELIVIVLLGAIAWKLFVTPGKQSSLKKGVKSFLDTLGGDEDEHNHSNK